MYDKISSPDTYPTTARDLYTLAYRAERIRNQAIADYVSGNIDKRVYALSMYHYQCEMDRLSSNHINYKSHSHSITYCAMMSRRDKDILGDGNTLNARINNRECYPRTAKYLTKIAYGK